MRMDFMEETLLDLLFLGQPRDRYDSLSWYSAMKKALFTNFWLTNSVTYFQFNLLVYCFTMVLSLIFCSRILKIAVRKIKVFLCHKPFCFCFWTPTKFKIVRFIAAYVQASVSWLTHFRLIAFMIGRSGGQSNLTRCSPTRSMNQSELSSMTRKHTSKSTAPISPSMKPIQMRKALHQILSKGKIQRPHSGKIQRPHSGKDSRPDKQGVKDTTGLKSQKRQTRQKTMPVVIDKFKGVMCLVPDHFEDHLTFSQSDEPDAIHSRVRKPAALRGKAVRRKETAECSETSRMGNETSITSITVEEATTELMSGNIRVIRHKYFAQTESSSAGAVQSGSFVKVSRENTLFCNGTVTTTVSSSERESNNRHRAKPRNEDGTRPGFDIKSPTSQHSVQSCPGQHYIPVLADAEQTVALNSQAPATGRSTKRRREQQIELDLCKENERPSVPGVSGPHREERTRKTRKTKTMRRTGHHLINGVDKTYLRQGGAEAAENSKTRTQSGRGEKKKLTRLKSSASDSVSSGPVIAEVALSKSSQDVCGKSVSIPSHVDYERSRYHGNTASLQSNKSRGKLEHLNVSGFPDSLKRTARERDGNFIKEPAKDTTPKSDEYPRWGSETLSDKVNKKVLYGAPEAKPPPGKPSPRKTFHEKEASDKIGTDFKLCDKKLRTNLIAENPFFSRGSRMKLRPTDTGADFKGASLYPTQFMSIFGMKHFSEDYISSGHNSSGHISSGHISSAHISSGHNSSEHIFSGHMQPEKVISGLRFDVTSLMPAPEPRPALVEAPKVVSTQGYGLWPDITTKSHPQTVEENPTIKNLTKEQDTVQHKQTVLTTDSKDVRFDVLGDSGRRVAVADQILNDAESIVTTTADDTKCFPAPKSKARDKYEVRQVKGQKATGAIRHKIGVRKYQPYTNPRLVKNETVLNHHKWYSSTALTQSSSSMKETRSSNETKDTLIEERWGASKNQTSLKSSMSRGDDGMTDRTQKLTKQHPRILLSRPRIGQNVEGGFEPKLPGSSVDENEVKSAKKHNANVDPKSDDKSRKKFCRANSTDSSSDRDPARRRMRLENVGKAPFFTHKRNMFSTTNIRMIEALPEENLVPLAGRAQSPCKAGVRTGELKGASDFSQKDMGKPHRDTEIQKDPASVMGPNSTPSGSRQTTASKRQSDDAMSCASKKSRKDTERGNKLETNKVVLKSKTTRHVLSETVTSPRLGKDENFKLRVAKTEGDLLELRKKRAKRLSNGGSDDTRVTYEKMNSAAGVTIRRRIRKILSSSCDDIKHQPQDLNGKAKVSRIPIYVGASLTKSFSAVNSKRDVQSLKQKVTRSLTNNTTAHQQTRCGEAVAALRKGPLNVSGGEAVAKDTFAASQKSGNDSQRKSSVNRLDKHRARDAINGAKPDESDMRMCRHFEDRKSNFGKLTITGANQELKAVLPMLIDHSKDSIIIITPDTKVKQLTSIIDNAGQHQPGASGSRTGVTAPRTRHQRLAVTHEKGGQHKHYMPRDGRYDEDEARIGSSFSGLALADEDLNTHIANKRLRHICSPQACRLCGTHTQDNTTCEMGKVEQMTSHQQYTMNTQKLLFRRTLTRQDDVKVRYDPDDAAAERKDGQINEYFIMHDAYRVFERKKSPGATKQDSAASSFNGKHLQSDDDRASSMNSPQSSSPKMGKQTLHHKTRAAINSEDLETRKGKKKSKKSNVSVKSSESRTVKSAGTHSPMPAKTETLLPDDAKNDDDESDVIQVVTYEDYHCRSETTTAPPGESPRIMSSPVPGYQRNTRSYSMKIAKESFQKVGSRPVQSDYIIDPEMQHYRISRIHKRKNTNPVVETTGKPYHEDDFPTRQPTQDRQYKYRSAALQRKPTYLPANQLKRAIENKANLPARFDEDERNGCNAQGRLGKFPERRDSNRKSAQGIPDDRKYGEILHKAGETSRAWAKIRTGEVPKLREAKLNQVSSMGYKVTDGAVDKGRKATDMNIHSTTRKAADVTEQKLSEPGAAMRGRRTPLGLTDSVTETAIEKNYLDSSKLKQFYLKRNFAKLKNPFTTITRQKANLRVLDALETKHPVHHQRIPYSEEPKTRHRLDNSTKDHVTRLLKGSVDKQTDSLLKGSTTGAANLERITCIPSTVRVKQTKTSLQRQRSSHLHHEVSQYMTFAWQADDKITKHREEKNLFTSSKVDDNRASFDNGHVLESSPDRTDPDLDEKDATHTLPWETSPKAQRKKADSVRERLAEQAKGNIMFVSNKSPIKTQSQISEPNQNAQSYDKNQTDHSRGGRIHYRNGRRIMLKETDDTAGIMDPPTQSSNIEISREDNVLTKEFDGSTTMPSTEAEMRFHNESKPRIKMSEKSNTISRHQAKLQPDASRKTSNHVLGAATKKCESSKKTLYSMKGDPKVWGLNKQRIAQNVRAVLSSADFEKVWKRIETTKSETGVISSEDQRWIVNQLLLGGTESVQKSSSEPQNGDTKRVNEHTYKIIHDKLHRPSSRVVRNGSDESLPKTGSRKNHDNVAMEVSVDCKQKRARRSPPESTDYMSEGRKKCTSSPHSNPTAIVLMGQKLYGNSMVIEISDKNDKDEHSIEILSDVDVKDSCRNYDAAPTKKTNIFRAKEPEAATKSEMTINDDTHDRTNTFPRRKKRRHYFLDDQEETVCAISEPQRHLKPTEHSRSTALASYIADIIPWVGQSMKGKQQLSTHLQKTISSGQSGSLRTSNSKIHENNIEEATLTIDDEKKSKAAFADDTSILRGEEGGVVNSRPKPDNPYRSPKSMTAVGNAANLYTQAWRKRSSSVLEINLGTIDEEVVFPKSVTPAQMPEKHSTDNLLYSVASKTVLSTTAGDGLNPWSSHKGEIVRERTNEAAISLLEECLFIEASSVRGANAANAHQSVNGGVTGPVSPICKLKAHHDGARKKNKEADPSCDSRNSMWKFDDSPSTADIVISWLAQTNDTELSIGRLTDQDVSNGQLASSANLQVKSDVELGTGTAKEERRKQKSTSGITLWKGDKCGKSSLEEVKTDPLGERISSRKRVRGVEKETLKTINDVGPAWWLKQADTEAANVTNCHKNEKTVKNHGKEKSAKAASQKTGGSAVKSIMRGRGFVRDRAAWPKVSESKIAAWKKSARKRVEPISDQYPSSRGANGRPVLNDDADKGEGKSSTRFHQTSSIHKLTANKSLSILGNVDPRSKDDTLARSDNRNRYVSSHHTRPAQSIRHGTSKQSTSLQFFPKSDSSTGNVHSPSGKDQTDHRHAARNVTENNNLKIFRVELTKFQSATNEPGLCNSLFHESNEMSVESGTQSSTVVGWNSTDTSSDSNLDTVSCGTPNSVQGNSQATQHDNNPCSKSEASIFSQVSFDWYKPLTAPFRSTCQTAEVSVSDQVDTQYLDSLKNVSKEGYSCQSSPQTRSESSGTCSTVDPILTREHTMEENEKLLAYTHGSPGSGGRKNREDCNKVVETSGRKDLSVTPERSVETWGCGAGNFGPLLDKWDTAQNSRGVVGSSHFYSEKSPQHACSVKRSFKHACSIKRSVKGNFLSIGDELRFKHTSKAGREEGGKLEESADRTESLIAPSEIKRQANLLSDSEGYGENPGQCSWVGHDCKGDCENRPVGDGVTSRVHEGNCGQADPDVRRRNSLGTPESLSRSIVEHDHLFNDLCSTCNVADLHLHTADVESYSKQYSSPEIPTSACCSMSELTYGHTSNQSSDGVAMTSSQERLVKPMCGFSYLYNHDTATPDPPTGMRSSFHPIFLRVRPPNANTMVGKLVKMFEKRLKFRPRPDVFY